MRLFFLIAACSVALIVIILSAAQFGASCTWYLINPTAHPVFVMLLTALLGGFMGAFFILFFISPKQKKSLDDMDDDE